MTEVAPRSSAQRGIVNKFGSLAMLGRDPARPVAFHYCLFLAAAGGVGRIFAQGSLFAALGISLSFD